MSWWVLSKMHAGGPTITPEHLEVHARDPRALLPCSRLTVLFLGETAAEVFADKVAGTNHILPTLRGARNTGGLWVGHFLKVITHQWVDERGVKVLAPYSVRQAEFETMDAHRRAALIRLTNKLDGFTRSSINRAYRLRYSIIKSGYQRRTISHGVC
jgi:histidinol dehydrogenase/sulfopropanediol 3-dehydrogenase